MELKPKTETEFPYEQNFHFPLLLVFILPYNGRLMSRGTGTGQELILNLGICFILSIIFCIPGNPSMSPSHSLRLYVPTTFRAKFKLFSREPNFPSRGRILIFSQENVNIENYCVLNCFFFAVNCPKPTPSPILELFQLRVDHCSWGAKYPNPLSIFTRPTVHEHSV